MSAEPFTLPVNPTKGTKNMPDPATCLTRRDRAIVEIEGAFPDIAADAQPLDAGEPAVMLSADAFVRLVELNTVIARSAMRVQTKPLPQANIAHAICCMAMELRDVLAAARSIEDRLTLH